MQAFAISMLRRARAISVIFAIMCGILAGAYAPPSLAGYPPSPVSYLAPWLDDSTYNADGTNTCLEDSLSGAEGCAEGWESGRGFTDQDQAWTPFQSPSDCLTYSFAPTQCVDGNFFNSSGHGTYEGDDIGQVCVYGGTVGAELNDDFGDTYNDWCLVEYTGQDLPPFTPCIGGYNTDPLTGQCIPPAAQNSAPPGPDIVGEPISAGSGNLYEAATDYKGGGPFPLVLKRAYNSGLASLGQNFNGIDQSLGSGWTNTFGAHLSVYTQAVQYSVCTDESTLNHQGQPDPYYGVQFVCPSTVGPVMGSATLWRGDGTREVFSGQLQLSGEPASGLTPEPGTTGELLYSGGTYTYVRTDGYSEIYNSMGQLTAVKDPQGLQQTYTYGYVQDNDLVYLQTLTVTDPAGRQMVFNYDATPTDANFGRVTSVTVPSNTASTGTATITYGYDASGNLQTVTYPDSSALTYEYNDPALPHALTGIKDENGNESAAWSFDDTTGKATCTELAPSANVPSTATTCTNDSAGVAKATISYNADGSADVTEATGLVRHLTFTTVNGRYVLATASQPCTACGNKIASISYDSNGDGYVSSTTDFNGVVMTYTHDAMGRETSRVEASGTTDQRTITTTWNGLASLPETVFEYDTSNGGDKLMRDTLYCYNANGSTCNDGASIGVNWTKKIVDPNYSLSRTTTYDYNSQDFLVSVIDPNGHSTNFTYTGGSLTKVTNALSQAIQITSYTASGLPLTLVDPNNVATTLAYDARGRLLTREVNDTNHVTTYVYYPAGDLKSVTKPNGAALAYGYDNAYRLTNITDILGDKVTYTLDNLGNMILEQVTDPSNRITKTHQRVYNTFNELTQDIGGMGQITSYSNFDGDGNAQTITDPKGHVTQRSFDHLGRIDSVTDANNGVTTYVYDSLSGLTDVTDPRGLTTQYQRNAYGEVMKLISPDTGTTTYLYDSTGNLTYKQDAKTYFDYSYDAVNRLTNIGTSSSNFTWVYTYDQGTDGIGHLTSTSFGSGTSSANGAGYTYDAYGNITGKGLTIGGKQSSISYNYDADHNLTAIMFWLPGPPVDYQQVLYTLDGMGRISGVSTRYLDTNTWAWTTPSPLATNVTYEPFGPLDGLTNGNGLVETRTFDADYRVKGISTGDSALHVQGLGYTYDADNNITAVTDSADAAGYSFAQTLGYDNLDRVTSTNGAYTLDYAYDADGNRTSTTNTTNGDVKTYTYDSASNKMLSIQDDGTTTWKYTYDSIGEVTSEGFWIWGYPLNERLWSVNYASNGVGVSDYTYDALGQRVQKLVGSTYTDFIYDESGHLLAELNGSDVQQTAYVWLYDRPLAFYPNGDFRTAPAYIHTDNLDTPRVMTNSAGTQVGWVWQSDPFGLGGQNAIHFGQNFHLTLPGMYVDPETGINYNNARNYNASLGRYYESDPIGLAGGNNTYVYALDNPIGNSDPSGLDTLVMVGAGISSNPFGHVAIAFTGRGTFSYGTKEPFGSSTTDYLANQASYRDTTTFWLPTTPQQEQEMITYIEANYAQPGQYSATTHNCSTMVIGALSAGGIGNDTLMQIESGGYIPPQLPSTAAIIAGEAPGAQIINIPQGSSVPPVFGSFNP